MGDRTIAPTPVWRNCYQWTCKVSNIYVTERLILMCPLKYFFVGQVMSWPEETNGWDYKKCDVPDMESLCEFLFQLDNGLSDIIKKEIPVIRKFPYKDDDELNSG